MPGDRAVADQAPAIDSLLESAELEGQLLAKLAEQAREIERLRVRCDRLETALANALENITVQTIHECPTNPPSAGAAAIASEGLAE